MEGTPPAFYTELPPAVAAALIGELALWVAPGVTITSRCTDNVLEYACRSWNCIALTVATLLLHTHDCETDLPVRDLGESENHLSPTHVDQSLFIASRLKIKLQDHLLDQLGKLLLRVDVGESHSSIQKDASAFWSPTTGLGPFYRWIITTHFYSSVIDSQSHVPNLIPSLQPSAFRSLSRPTNRARCDASAYTSPPYLRLLMQTIFSRADEGQLAERQKQYAELHFFSSTEASNQFFGWLNSGLICPTSNFSLLPARIFYKTTSRRRFLDKLITKISRPSRKRPLVVVEAKGSRNGLTALASALRTRFEDDDRLVNFPALYIPSGRFQANECHKSLGYYVSIIMAWLDGSDTCNTTPIQSRADIFAGIKRIRTALANHSLVLIFDGVEADRGAFEDILDVINDNPVKELIANLISSSTDSSISWGHDFNRTPVGSTVVLLTTGSWKKYSGLIRYSGRLPAVSSRFSTHVLKSQGLGCLAFVQEALAGRVANETEVALIDILACLNDSAIKDNNQAQTIIEDAIARPSIAHRYALFELVQDSLKTMDPDIRLAAFFIASCPGGLRLRSLQSCLSRLNEKINIEQCLDRLTRFPALFVIGNDEILPLDGRQQDSSSPSRVKINSQLISATRERSVDIKIAEIRELIVSHLISRRRDLWFSINTILAEEALRQWTDQIRISEYGELQNLACHRRLVQSVWHGLQSSDFSTEITEKNAGTDKDSDTNQLAVEEFLPEINHLPADAHRRYLHITTFLIRRCLEWNSEWQLARSYVRHRMRVALIAAAHNPTEVREYLAKQYAARRVLDNRGPTKFNCSWDHFFNQFPISRPPAFAMNHRSSLGPHERSSLYSDQLISLGHAALENGLKELAANVTKELDGVHFGSKAVDDGARLKVVLELYESRNDMDTAMDLIRNSFGEHGVSGVQLSLSLANLRRYGSFPLKPIDVMAMRKDAAKDAQTLSRQQKNKDSLTKPVSTLLRYAQILATKADSLDTNVDSNGFEKYFDNLLQAFYFYIVADTLRIIWRDRQPLRGNVSAKPSRYFARVCLKLYGFCLEASKKCHEQDIKNWEISAKAFWEYGKYATDVYARRFFKYELDRAYMNILSASYLVKRAYYYQADTDQPQIDFSYQSAFDDLRTAESILSDLGFPLSPSRRFYLERVKLFRAIVHNELEKIRRLRNAGDTDVLAQALGLERARAGLRHAWTNLHFLCHFNDLSIALEKCSENPRDMWTSLAAAQKERIQQLFTSYLRLK